MVESFLDKEVKIKILLDKGAIQIIDAATSEIITGVASLAPIFRNRKFGKDAVVFEVTLKAHSFKGFRF